MENVTNRAHVCSFIAVPWQVSWQFHVLQFHGKRKRAPLDSGEFDLETGRFTRADKLVHEAGFPVPSRDSTRVGQGHIGCTPPQRAAMPEETPSKFL